MWMCVDVAMHYKKIDGHNFDLEPKTREKKEEKENMSTQRWFSISAFNGSVVSLWFCRRCHVALIFNCIQSRIKEPRPNRQRGHIFYGHNIFQINCRRKCFLFSFTRTNVLLFITNMFRSFAHRNTADFYAISEFTVHEHRTLLMENNFRTNEEKKKKTVEK